MSDFLNFLSPWVQWVRNLSRKPILRSLKRGEYGQAALYREWRLLDQQQRDNAAGRFGRVYFKVGE